MVLKRRFETIDAMTSKLALLENKSKTKGRAKSKQHHETTEETTTENPRRGSKRKIRSSTTRAMLAQLHFKFKMLLKYTMDRVGGRVVEFEEEYISKTCSSCGVIKNDLGGSNMYKRPFCHAVHDRDVNAAKNIQILC
ncbi:hypothetical protein BBO99_00003539 [Phytophthora kernoviae]|uniref:Cas12f1-like TNB domain-containing protein n=2 Tax=Phytophthora kernoviae TaxID=325452 RepID=A0A3R7NI95_9STRA|nr:hypothetical protein G195_004298 [Phytophthora kernoviae 00238/432]KAG2527230.1 hypothetical protein JM16_003313 [Phytophthora kernoviae]KAG2528627.1 hypothetical protein JM18_003221 [Phytophthora kernoviae]RLN15123.1 hypothetical protein BBI17_003569 [Phytophthora kernoviae]RLN81637.1 hypothetical protein BBO99_00003539 [Phytophthora kernoviae]